MLNTILSILTIIIIYLILLVLIVGFNYESVRLEKVTRNKFGEENKNEQK